MVVPLLKRGETPPPLHRQGVGLRAVGAEEAVPQAVEAVRGKGRGHELVGALVKQLVVDDAVLAAASGAVQGHLEILVVNGDLVVGELGVGVHAQPPLPPGRVFQRQIPQLHVLPPGDEQGLGGADPVAGALVHRVAQPVAAAVVLQRPSAGLPGHRPVLPRLIIPDVDIVARAVHGHAVGAEAGDAVVLRALVKEVAPGGMVDHRGHVLHAQVIGPGHGHVHPVNDVLPLFLVKVSIFHGIPPPASQEFHKDISLLYPARGGTPGHSMRSFAADCQSAGIGRAQRPPVPQKQATRAGAAGTELR